MREGGALAVTAAAAVLLATVRYAANWRTVAPSKRKTKRVSFSTEEMVIHLTIDDLSDKERRDLSYTAAELRQFSRARAIEGWLEDWGS